MTGYLNYNGSTYAADDLIISADNRGFRYGDGLFETMKVAEGRIQLGAYHFERLFAGLSLLQFDKPGHFTSEFFTGQVLELVRKNKLTQAKARLMVFRGSGGLYEPEDNYPHFIIQAETLHAGIHPPNENGLSVGVYTDARIPADRFSHLKSNNFLAYRMGAIFTKRQNLDDSLLLNTNGGVCESTMANVFVIKDNLVLTPSLHEGCVAGVMRRYLLESLHTVDLSARECGLSLQDLEHADEMFLTNAVAGIRWVRRCGGKEYSREITARIAQSLLKDLP